MTESTRSLTRRAALGLGLVAGVAHAAGPPLTLAANEKLAVQWVASRMLKAIYAKAGLELQVVALPATRANLETVGGLRDGEVARIAAYGERNPTLLRVPTPYYYIATTAFSLKSRSAAVRSRADLVHYSVGAIRGVTHAQDITEGHPSVTLTPTAEQLFRMLQSGRFDLALDTRINGEYVVQRGGLRDIEISPDLARHDLFHFLHPRHAARVDAIDAVIRQMRASGELERLRLQAEADLITIALDTFSGTQP